MAALGPGGGLLWPEPAPSILLGPTPAPCRHQHVDAGVDVLVLWVHAPHDHDVLACIAAASEP